MGIVLPLNLSILIIKRPIVSIIGIEDGDVVFRHADAVHDHRDLTARHRIVGAEVYDVVALEDAAPDDVWKQRGSELGTGSTWFSVLRRG